MIQLDVAEHVSIRALAGSARAVSRMRRCGTGVHRARLTLLFLAEGSGG
jgi:hypothetical protein